MVESISPAYPQVVKGALQIVSSLWAKAEPGEYNKPSRVDPNDDF